MSNFSINYIMQSWPLHHIYGDGQSLELFSTVEKATCSINIRLY